MDGFAPMLLFLVGILVVAGLAYYSYQRKLERQRELRSLASANGSTSRSAIPSTPLASRSHSFRGETAEASRT